MKNNIVVYSPGLIEEYLQRLGYRRFLRSEGYA